MRASPLRGNLLRRNLHRRKQQRERRTRQSPSSRRRFHNSRETAAVFRRPWLRAWLNKKSPVPKRGRKKLDDEYPSALRAEAESLEEILKNQSHPKNLVAVKKSGTPVVATASLTAKTLFLASAHDEFEMLDFNRDWVHVRISGLSRGWIWRNSLEMPDSVPQADAPASRRRARSPASYFM